MNQDPIDSTTPPPMLTPAPPDEPKPRHIVRKVLIGVGILVLALAILGVLGSFDIITIGRFKPITYDNGSGATFSLSFYSHYKTEPSSQAVGATADSTVPSSSSGSMVLVSGTSFPGKAPLVLRVSRAAYSVDTYNRYHNCTDTLPQAFTVYSQYLNDNINLCALRSGSSDLVYIGVFPDSQNQYLYSIVVTQALDFTEGQSSQAGAQATVSSAGLSVYQKDLTTIIGSLKPLN